MKGIALVTILSLFSVAIPIQSLETVYTYNYDNFGDIFNQSGGVDDFHLYKYSDNDTIFDKEYKGTNIGGAFLVQGSSRGITPEFEGYVELTATFYCGGTYRVDGSNSLIIGVHYDDMDHAIYLCQERGWHYNYTFVPPAAAKYQKVIVFTGASDANATANRAYGFDELRITTSDTPTQLLQRDNTSSNDP